VRLRIFVEPQQGAHYDTVLGVAQTAEESGFEGFFRSDHYLKMGGTGMPGPTDAWITLAGIARETKKVRLGTLMTAATFRYPGPLAIEVANVDHMSGGRVELGLGAAWYEQEHLAYGIPFPSLRERFDRFEEQLEIITGIWNAGDDGFSFEGSHYQLSNNPGLPKPLQQTLPIIVGGRGPKRTAQLAARFADEFNIGFTTVEGSKAIFDNVTKVCESEGRTRKLALSVAQATCCGRDEDDVARRAAKIGRDVSELRENGLAGTPRELIEKIKRFEEIGCDRVYLQILDMSDLDHLKLIASDVLPFVTG
jgi:alkanesulfonate monooxygenase